MTTPRHTDPGSLRCPECGDPARPVPPAAWPLSGFAARLATSHADGTPLCPVFGPHGVHPANPIGTPARLTLWQAVRQTWLAHPDWTVTDHLAWLDGEGYDTDTGGDPAEVIGRWLAEHRRATRPTAPPDLPDRPRVYVVAGGDLVAAFTNPEAAGIQRTVMQAANLDTTATAMTPARWATVQAVLRAEHPDIVITDVTGYPA